MSGEGEGGEGVGVDDCLGPCHRSMVFRLQDPDRIPCIFLLLLQTPHGPFNEFTIGDLNLGPLGFAFDDKACHCWPFEIDYYTVVYPFQHFKTTL